MEAMARRRSHSMAFKRQVAQEFVSGETLHGLAKRHDISRNLIRLWVQKYEAGAFDEDATAADMIQEYETRIAALERIVGKQALELEFLKGGAAKRTATEVPAYVRDCRSHGLSVTEGCRLMGIARSTYDDRPALAIDDTALVEAISVICDEFEAYGGVAFRPRCGSEASWRTTRRFAVSCANTICSRSVGAATW